MSLNFLYSSDPLTNFDLDEIEQIVLKENDLLSQVACRLLSEVRRLTHALNDPQYMYAGDRVNRMAVITRNLDIVKLNDELTALKKQLQST